ncbi:MAG TPA: hypothetical protein VKU60_03140, partial [Chloroflexota bacterium]|nr:hypothetical protein [Chloroflexota bacterium]
AQAARRLGGPVAGVFAALLLAISPFHIWWSQQIRMYALAGLLASLSICLLLRLVGVGSRESGVGSPKALAGLFAVNLLGLYTLYFFGAILLLECVLVVVCWVRAREPALRRAWLLAIGWLLATAGPYAPWLAYFRQHALHYAQAAAPPLPVRTFLAASWSQLVLGVDTNLASYQPLILATGLVAALLVAWLLRRKGPLALWLALATALLPTAAYAATLSPGAFFNPMYHTRYDLLALPPLILLLAWSAATLPFAGRVVGIGVLAGAAIYMLPGFYQQHHRTDDYQSLARLVQAYERAGDAIVFDPDTNFQLFLLDYEGQLPLETIPLNQPVDAAYADRLFSRWTSQYGGLWLLQESGGHDAGAQHPVRDWLEAHLQPSLHMVSGDRLLTLYQPRDAAPRTIAANFRPRFALLELPGFRGFDQPMPDVRPGDVLHLALYEDEASAAARLSLAGRAFAPQLLPGELQFTIPIGAWAPPGAQPIALITPDGRTVPFSSVNVEGLPGSPAANNQPLAHAVGRDFGGLTRLTSYQMDSQPHPGGTLNVELQWQALQPFDANYTVFVHLLDGTNRVVAQQDAQPLDGQLPTIAWQSGQIVNDQHAIPLPAALPAGDYRVEVGLYLQSTGERLSLSDAPSQDSLILDPIQVMKSEE